SSRSTDERDQRGLARQRHAERLDQDGGEDEREAVVREETSQATPCSGLRSTVVTVTREDRPKNASPPPAPRGSSPTPPQLPPRLRRGGGWLLFFIALLVFNFYFGSRATQPSARVRVAYSPFFLQQVTAGHVKAITSKGTAIQ